MVDNHGFFDILVAFQADLFPSMVDDCRWVVKFHPSEIHVFVI